MIPFYQIMATLLFSGINLLIFLLFIGFAIFFIYIAAYIAIPILLILFIFYIIAKLIRFADIKITHKIFTKKHASKHDKEENIIDVDYTEIK